MPTLLLNSYTFGPYELKKCKTFESLKKYVAAKVNVEL